MPVAAGGSPKILGLARPEQKGATASKFPLCLLRYVLEGISSSSLLVEAGPLFRGPPGGPRPTRAAPEGLTNSVTINKPFHPLQCAASYASYATVIPLFGIPVPSATGSVRLERKFTRTPALPDRPTLFVRKTSETATLLPSQRSDAGGGGKGGGKSAAPWAMSA